MTTVNRPTVKPRLNITVPPPPTMEEMNLDDLDMFDGRRICIIGPSGAGKTWLASTWPRPAFIDADFNIKTLKQESYKLYAGQRQQIVLAQPQDQKDPNTGMVTKPNGFWDMLAKSNEWSERPDIDTIVYDSLSAISNLANALGVNIAGLDNRSLTEKEAKNKLKVFLMTQADYGAEMNVMEQFLQQLPELNKNIICIAHSRQEKSKTGAFLHYSPLITGEKMRAGLGRWFNEVWWLEVQGTGANKKRVLFCHQDNLHPFVKTTMDLPEKIEDPTYKKIMQLAGKVV